MGLGRLKGSVSYTFDSVQSHLAYRSAVTDLCFSEPRNRPDKLADVLQESRCPILHIGAPALTLEPDVFRPAIDQKSPWVLLGREAELSCSADFSTYNTFVMTFTQTAHWRLIYLGQHNVWSYVLVLQSCPEADTWQRVGIFSSNRGQEEFAKLPQQRKIRTAQVM